MQRNSWSLWSIVPLAASMLLTACPAPKYPKCEKDQHCAEYGEVCANGQCQECREDTECMAKYPEEERVCVDGRCEIKPQCAVDADCTAVGEGLVCKAGECVPECTQDTDCPVGRKCVAQQCVAECQANVDCGPDRVCVEGSCKSAAEYAAMQVSSACRSTTPGEIISLGRANFDFDQYDLTPSTRQTLEQNAECLKQAPAVRVIIEGHCDSRGTQEYNLALGEKRANAVKTYLRNLGVSESRLTTRSKGENEPLCENDTESCYAQNRRVEFIQQLAPQM